MSLKFEYLGGNCPVQSEGKFDDLDFYFRARGQHWSIELIDPTTLQTVFEMRVLYCDDNYGAGWIPRDEAFIIIVSTYFKWKRNMLPR